MSDLDRQLAKEILRLQADLVKQQQSALTQYRKVTYGIDRAKQDDNRGAEGGTGEGTGADSGSRASEGTRESPRVEGKVLGFRSWRLDGHKLRALSVHATWGLGVQEARCTPYYNEFMERVPPVHEAPDHECPCGLYAFHTPVAPDESNQVVGAILAWGRMEVHNNGFRAQYAQPVVFSYAEDQPYNHVLSLKALAEEWEIPCVPYAELEAKAREFGEPVAQEHRPAPMGGSHDSYVSALTAYNQALKRTWTQQNLQAQLTAPAAPGALYPVKVPPRPSGVYPWPWVALIACLLIVVGIGGLAFWPSAPWFGGFLGLGLPTLTFSVMDWWVK